MTPSGLPFWGYAMPKHALTPHSVAKPFLA